jgi:hypothetical protein
VGWNDWLRSRWIGPPSFVQPTLGRDLASNYAAILESMGPLLRGDCPGEAMEGRLYLTLDASGGHPGIDTMGGKGDDRLVFHGQSAELLSLHRTFEVLDLGAVSARSGWAAAERVTANNTATVVLALSAQQVVELSGAHPQGPMLFVTGDVDGRDVVDLSGWVRDGGGEFSGVGSNGAAFATFRQTTTLGGQPVVATLHVQLGLVDAQGERIR